MKKTYYYDEIVRWIDEDKITLWDLSLKLDLSISSFAPLDNLLKTICNNNMLRGNRLKDQLKQNSEEYSKQNVDKTKKLDYNALIYFVNNGYSSTEIMKTFGYYDYQRYTVATRKLINSVSPEQATVLKEAKLKIKHNRKHVEVEILPNNEDTITLNEDNMPLSNEEEISTELENFHKYTKVANKNLFPDEVITSLPAEKIVIYSYEYLKYSKFEEELENFEEEKIILSVTLNKFLHDNDISEDKKFILINAINDPKINLRILTATSNYVNNGIKLAFENDLLLSQALMLAEYTSKDIYIAAQNNLTSINILTLGFGLRFSKNCLGRVKYIFEDDGLNYFDYIIKENYLSSLKGKKAYILDTCFIIANTSQKQKVRNYIYQSRDEEKLILYPVLKELKVFEQFSGILYAAKNNPTCKFILNVPLNYEVEDRAILNTAMYLKRMYNLDATILTHDFKLNMEALQYNFKSLYGETWWNKLMQEKQIYEERIETLEDKKDNNIFKTVSFYKMENGYSLLKDATLEKVMNENRKPLEVLGHKGFKFYSINIGCLIKFKNDPCLYSIISFEGENNLIAI